MSSSRRREELEDLEDLEAKGKPFPEEKEWTKGKTDSPPDSNTSTWSKIKRGVRIGFGATLAAIESVIFSPIHAVELMREMNHKIVDELFSKKQSHEPKSSPAAFGGVLIGLATTPFIIAGEVTERIEQANYASDKEEAEKDLAQKREMKEAIQARNKKYSLYELEDSDSTFIDSNEPSIDGDDRLLVVQRSQDGGLRYRVHGMAKSAEISNEELGSPAHLGALDNYKEFILATAEHRGHIPSLQRSLGLAILYGFFGFLAGLVLAIPQAVNSILINKREEPLTRTILYAPFRFLWTLVSTPFEKAEEWAWFRKKEAAPEPSRRLQPKKYAYQLTGFDYPRVSFYAVAGFFLGCIEATFYAIKNATRPRNDENAFWSLLMALPRFLGTLLTHPFEKAEQWYHDCRTQLDEYDASFFGDFFKDVKQKNNLGNYRPDDVSLSGHSPLGYIRLGLNAALGFIVGLSFGVITAFRKTIYPVFNDREKIKSSNLLETLYTLAGRFLVAFLKSPFQTAMDYAFDEAKALKKEEAAEFDVDLKAPRATTSRGIAALKLIGGFLLGLLAMPFIGTYTAVKNFIFEKRDEPFFATILKTPFRLVLDILTWPLSFAYDLAWPRRDLEAEKQEKARSRKKRSKDKSGKGEEPDEDEKSSSLSSTARARKDLGSHSDNEGDNESEYESENEGENECDSDHEDEDEHQHSHSRSKPHVRFNLGKGGDSTKGAQQRPAQATTPPSSFRPIASA